MKYVIARTGPEGFYCDPDAYLDALAELGPRLPPGARAFATEPGHYRFADPRCVKNLKPARVRIEGEQITLELRHSCFAHEEDLVLRYTGVTEHTLGERGELPGEVLLDELLPEHPGVRHEIRCWPHDILVVAADLTAEWRPTDCRG